MRIVEKIEGVVVGKSPVTERLELALEMLTKLCTHFKSRLFIALYIEQCCITNE
jgi:hypothetical protein